MKISWTLLLLVLTASAQSVLAQSIDETVGSLVAELAVDLATHKNTQVGVLELTDLSGRPTKLGRLVSEELLGQLHRRVGGSVQLIERAKVADIIGEIDRGPMGQLDAEAAKGFVRLYGVDGLIVGSMGEISGRVRINARLIGVPSGKLLATAAAFLGREGISADLFEPIGTQLPAQPPVSPTAVSDSDFSFSLDGCWRTASNVRCNFRVTDQVGGRHLSLDRDLGRLIGDDAGSYSAEFLRLGSSTGTFARMGDMPGGEPVQGSVVFKSVPTTVRHVNELSVGGYTWAVNGDRLDVRVKLKKIPIQGDVSD